HGSNGPVDPRMPRVRARTRSVPSSPSPERLSGRRRRGSDTTTPAAYAEQNSTAFEHADRSSLGPEDHALNRLSVLDLGDLAGVPVWRVAEIHDLEALRRAETEASIPSRAPDDANRFLFMRCTPLLSRC